MVLWEKEYIKIKYLFNFSKNIFYTLLNQIFLSAAGVQRGL